MSTKRPPSGSSTGWSSACRAARASRIRPRHRRSYRAGAMPFHVATARQRMQLAARDSLFDLPAGYTARLPELLGQLAATDVRAACSRHFHPANAVTVAVTTAEHARPALEAANAGPITVVRHDEY